MAFKKSRILTTEQFINVFKESADNKQRFCFILGSGASFDSKIPTGNELEMQWMNELMFKNPDDAAKPLGCEPEVVDDETQALRKQTKDMADLLYEDDEMTHRFDEIEKAWIEARRKPNGYLSSDYYFDLYKLRFHPNPQNGYRFLEQLMENKNPSLGYRVLSLLLTKTRKKSGDNEYKLENSNQHNLVITTNFDSLTEDALFLYSDKKPLVISHESLATYIDSDTQRPIIAKVHRGLMFDPFNSPETTDHLEKEWHEALNYAFKTYTPVVIGYGGGDGSLMTYLKNSTSNKGIYWCFLDKYGLPGPVIQKFVRRRNGCLVTIDGFDKLMHKLGLVMFPSEITPHSTDEYLKRQMEDRTNKYKEQFDSFCNTDKDTDRDQKHDLLTDDLEELIKDKSDNNNYLTHFNLAYEAAEKGNHNTAVHEYTLAIEKDPTSPIAYNNRGNSYADLGKYDQAIADYNKAIELDPKYAFAYNNRGNSYRKLGKYDQAIADYNKAIELDPNYAFVYNNRGAIYDNLGKYDQAIADYNKAIELDPKYFNAYNNRGIVYNRLSKYDQAIKDCAKAIELDPNYSSAYITRGNSYHGLGQYEQAIVDYSKAIELDPTYVLAYHNRGNSHRLLGHLDQAIQDCTEAIKLDPNCADAYRKRSYAYENLGETALAEADEAKVKELKAAKKTP